MSPQIYPVFETHNGFLVIFFRKMVNVRLCVGNYATFLRSKMDTVNVKLNKINHGVFLNRLRWILESCLQNFDIVNESKINEGIKIQFNIRHVESKIK